MCMCVCVYLFEKEIDKEEKTGGLRPAVVSNSTELTFFPLLIFVRVIVVVIVGEIKSTQ